MGTNMSVGDPRQPDERWCDVCQDWRGIVTTGSELDYCQACIEWRWPWSIANSAKRMMAKHAKSLEKLSEN